MKRGVVIFSTFLVFSLFSCVACVKNAAVPSSKVIVDEQKGLTDNQVNNLTDNQVGNLTDNQVSNLTDNQMNNLADNQMNKSADNQVNGSESTKSADENKSKEIYISEDSTPPAVNEQPRKETNVGISIITKSDNIYTDTQKMETLNQLTGEIDKLIESLNNLDGVPDSELTFN